MAKNKKWKKSSTLWIFKFLVIGGSVIFIVTALSNRLIFSLTHAELFKIRAVIVDPSLKHTNMTSSSLERLPGKNIFKVNLAVIEQDLRRRYPGADQLHLVRHFPDKIYVVAEHR